MPLFRKLRNSISFGSKNKVAAGHHAVGAGVVPVCHNCGHRSTLGLGRSASPGHEDEFETESFSWSRYSGPDSGYNTADSGSYSQSSRSSGASHAGSVASTLGTEPEFHAPTRQRTRTSSIYSDDDEDGRSGASGGLESFPAMPLTMESETNEVPDVTFDLPPRTLSNYSRNFVPKSRYARLNEMPILSPRASVFSDALLDMDAGIEVEDKNRLAPKRRNRWEKSGSLSILPSQLRRLSIGRPGRDQEK